eukprot:TRINITY_DN11923_c0_g2_i1.p1 TRINITY_DN11923_c0_g2~~TRINITY_DN11923_c0_g2_i1.p1  ORF type:complete len:161 (+),score=30.58 TRINITY_DN11923_c0_g2_i1:70-552(+)
MCIRDRYTTQSIHNDSRKINLVYDDFDIAGETVIKQWAVLLEYDMLPKDEELYTHCRMLLKRRARKLKNNQKKNTKDKQQNNEVGTICPMTGWLIDIATDKMKGRIIEEADFYTLTKGGKFLQKLLGCEKVIARQLEEIGGTKIEHFQKNGTNYVKYSPR